MNRHLAFRTVLALLLGTTLAPAAKVPFLSPDEAIAKMTYPEGFKVNAYAAEPEVIQPFAFQFDDRGRVWVLENLNYETRGSDTFKQGPKGRIIILEDTDGDGTADSRKVFKDEIFFPTGLALGFGGVWVGSPPNLLFFADRDGDDKPDGEPEVVLDGWGRQDRHETLNSFMWGPDGWLYGLHGVFTHSRVGKPGTPDHEREPINAGVWRYHPVKKDFEVFAWGTSNPWGMDFDPNGQVFITACVIPHLWHMIQGGRYHRQGGQHFRKHVYDDIKTIADHRHKSAHGGARFYMADRFPEKYQGRLFMCNIHVHNVYTDIIKPKGSGYEGTHGDSFMDSNDPQWLGFNMELGPDGSIYIIDWHDQDICGRKVVHGLTGRLWRISYGKDPAHKPFNLAALSDDELVEMHGHANEWYVRQARRLLHERHVNGKLSGKTAKALRQRFEEQENPHHKLKALWTLHVIGAASDRFLAGLLEHSEPYVRGWAIQLLAEDRKVGGAERKQFAAMAKEDESPVVRLFLASAAQRLPVEQRWDILEGLVGHVEDKDDHNLPLLIWYALEPAVAADSKKALALVTKVKIPKVASFVARRLAASNAEKPQAKARPVKVKPARTVSRNDLLLWYRADGVVAGADRRVSQWTDRLRNGRHAVQGETDARPRVVTIDGVEAVEFDGQDDHLILEHEKHLAFGAADSFTISTWVHLDEPQKGWRSLIAKSRDQQPWYGLWINPEGQWTFGGSGNNLAKVSAQEGWRHVCVVQDGAKNTRKVYVDGYLVDASTALDGSGPGELWIAGAKSTREFFRGAFHEIRLYGRALSHPEVVHFAEEGKGEGALVTKK